jgi:hypothetical protein
MHEEIVDGNAHAQENMTPQSHNRSGCKRSNRSQGVPQKYQIQDHKIDRKKRFCEMTIFARTYNEMLAPVLQMQSFKSEFS